MDTAPQQQAPKTDALSQSAVPGAIEPRIVVLIPCLNEEKTVGKVVRDFRAELPRAQVIVFDNDSTDQTADEARDAGAAVMLERRRGKGFVVQSMFERVEADVYVLVDGDDTYPANKVHELLKRIRAEEADMVVGSRISPGSTSHFHPLNRIGNLFYQRVIAAIFGSRLMDTLSGYRVMSRRLVKELPLFVTGFEVEVELTIKALERGYRIAEVPVDLRQRPEGSHSKVDIVRDGFRILWAIVALFRDYKPLTFFGILGMGAILLGCIPGGVAIHGYLESGLVLHFPSAILAVGLELAGMFSIAVGLILHTIDRRFQEMEHHLRRVGR